MLIRYNGGVAKGNAMATEQEVNMSPFILEGELGTKPGARSKWRPTLKMLLSNVNNVIFRALLNGARGMCPFTLRCSHCGVHIIVMLLKVQGFFYFVFKFKICRLRF